MRDYIHHKRTAPCKGLRVMLMETTKQVTPTAKKKPPNAGKGRPKGSQNKTTALLKDAILKAAEQAGGKAGMIGYLKTQAEENPGPFLALLGKVLPMQVEGAGENGEIVFKTVYEAK